MKSVSARCVKTVVARLERGEDLYASFVKLVQENDVRSGCLQAIGAVSRGKVGVFENGKYEWLVHEGALEISSLLGNVAVKEGKPFVHVHAVFGDEKGTIISGHVGEGCIVDPTAEVHLSIYEGELLRRLDPKTGLWILDI
ncbi:MAG TPA: DNA-binding protein [bacterium]|nr:DNA-binding protein [bacterium]